MPIQVNLVVHGEAAMPAMSVCPAVARPGCRLPEGWFDVTTIAVAQDPYRQRFVEASDAAFIAWCARETRGAPSALALSDLTPRGRARRAYIAGEVRAPLLRWLRSVAFATRTPIDLIYDHERGDWPYESAVWSWYPTETLRWTAYEGTATVQADAHLEVHHHRAPDEVRFGTLAAKLRDVVVRDGRPVRIRPPDGG